MNSALAVGAKVHASPSVRAYARELGVDLSKVAATGPKNRIVKEDLTKYVKGVMSGAISGPVASATGGVVGGGVLDLLPWPKVNFEKFGEIEVKPLSRIKKISGQNLSRNWVMIPAVTYHEDADITDLEAFRVILPGVAQVHKGVARRPTDARRAASPGPRRRARHCGALLRRREAFTFPLYVYNA